MLPQCSVINPQTIYQLDKTGIWGEAVRQRKDIMVNDFHAPHPLKKGFPEGHAPLHKFLTVPIYRDEQIVAVVGVANKATDYDQNNVLQLKILMDSVWREVGIKQAEKELRQSEEMMRSSQSVAHIGSYSTNLNVNEIEKSQWVCSPEFYKIFGADETYPHTIAGWAGFIHPDHREEVVTYHESVVKEKKPFNREYKIIRINDGAERWVQGTGELEFDEKGKPIRMYGAIQDITKRKQAENELRKLKENLEDEVQEKTKELKERISELERFHEATIEREFRIKELRDEMEQLKKDLSKQ